MGLLVGPVQVHGQEIVQLELVAVVELQDLHQVLVELAVVAAVALEVVLRV
jgi:hypothetical protein